MLLTPPQAQIAKSLARFRVVNCGRRFGKTTEACEEIKGKALGKPTRICYIAPTYQQARDIAWEQLKRELLPITIQANESRLELRTRTQNEGESIVFLRGWESVETLRGQQFDFLVIDEVASMRNFWMNWQEVLRPTLTDTKGEVLFISTPKGFNHFYDLYNLEGKDKDYKSFHFTTYDNPYIPKEEVDKARLELTEDRFAQEYLADFRKTEGLVYKEFNRELHLFDKDVQGELLGGVDFGFTNPAAVLQIVKDKDANYWVKDEWYKTGRTEPQIAEYVASCKFNRVYPDPENPSAIEALNQKGIRIVEVVKGKDSVMSGVNRVREMFKSNRLKIHRSCINLISELETYSYPEKQGGHNPQENPVKENDHALDALRYVIMMDSMQPDTSGAVQAQQQMFRRNMSSRNLNSSK